jgi:heme/copper-type cytochrome/quinol oxidase subunit 4
MTPTLFGRWQTRILLFATVGVLTTLPFYLGIVGSGSSRLYFPILLYIALFGLVWDIVYNYLQKFRWDRDWPAIFQVLAGIWEAIFAACVIKIFGLPGVPRDLPLTAFALHYSFVWLGIFIASQSVMRLLFPRWRFKGGQWL